MRSCHFSDHHPPPGCEFPPPRHFRSAPPAAAASGPPRRASPRRRGRGAATSPRNRWNGHGKGAFKVGHVWKCEKTLEKMRKTCDLV